MAPFGFGIPLAALPVFGIPLADPPVFGIQLGLPSRVWLSLPCLAPFPHACSAPNLCAMIGAMRFWRDTDTQRHSRGPGGSETGSSDGGSMSGPRALYPRSRSSTPSGRVSLSLGLGCPPTGGDARNTRNTRNPEYRGLLENAQLRGIQQGGARG
jgi:hypothetical protein